MFFTCNELTNTYLKYVTYLIGALRVEKYFYQNYYYYYYYYYYFYYYYYYYYYHFNYYQK